MPICSIANAPLRLFFSLCLLAVGACASGPPVQEMSDARQAIAAAREAGAATYADEGLRSAEARLAEAETQLNQRMYWDAKRLAAGRQGVSGRCTAPQPGAARERRHRRRPKHRPDCPVTAVVAARRFVVSGKVQGVFFRASTVRVAEQLKLRGFARNLPDGRVEVLALGDTAALEELAGWLRKGPPLASVTGVTGEDEDVGLYADVVDFRTG